MEQPQQRQVEQLIERCGYGAAALTIIPIPGSEFIAVMPLHVGMVVGIGETYGQRVTRESAMKLVTHIGATVGLSLVGSKLATTAGKLLLPGLGGLIAAPFIYAATLGIGHVAKLYYERGELSEREIRQAYQDALRHAKQTFDPRRARSNEARQMAEEVVRSDEPRDDDVGSAGSRDAAARAGRPAQAGPPDMDELAERLADLEELHERGDLSAAEYEARRQQILDQI